MSEVAKDEWVVQLRVAVDTGDLPETAFETLSEIDDPVEQVGTPTYDIIDEIIFRTGSGDRFKW